MKFVWYILENLSNYFYLLLIIELQKYVNMLTNKNKLRNEFLNLLNY